MDNAIKVDRTIKLPGLMEVINDAQEAKKALLFFDQTKNLSVFFSYKAALYELNKDMLSMALGKKTKADVNENFRKNIVRTMKTGDNLVIFVDNSMPNFKDEFTDASCVHPDIFDLEVMDQKQNYMTMVRQEENVDVFGAKGGYYKKDNWMISVLTLATIEEEGEKIKKCLPLDKFMIVKVIN